MKKTTIFAVAAVCGAAAFAVPDWNQSLNAAYPNPKYEIYDAVVLQKLTIAGCKPLKMVTTGDVTLYDDQSFASFRYDVNNNLVDTLTGTWELVNKGSKNTFYMSMNTSSMINLSDELVNTALASPNCPGVTGIDILQPTVLVKKNFIVGSTKNSLVAGTLQLSGQQQNNLKSGKVTLTTVFKKATLVGPIP